jgi:hypothetical protein
MVVNGGSERCIRKGPYSMCMYASSLTSGRNMSQLYCKCEDTTLQEMPMLQWVRSEGGGCLWGLWGRSHEQDIETKPGCQEQI